MKHYIIIAGSALFLLIVACSTNHDVIPQNRKTRQLVDTVGFAHYPWQIDSLMHRFISAGFRPGKYKTGWKLAICPHDDYTYTGDMYSRLLQNVTAPNIILIGVAHKAAALGISDSLVFDTFTYWKGPWSDVQVSQARNKIYNHLKGKYAMLSDSLASVEHSLEALIPFLQYYNRKLNIIPVLVPAMSPERMKECGIALGEAIKTTAGENRWTLGKDYVIVATTDAVHYGNEDWNGRDMAKYGCDEHGNMMALGHEMEILDRCFDGELNTEKIARFSNYTLQPDNYREYKWTWCGRYSVPVALYTAYYLAGKRKLKGELVDYSTSISRLHIPVDDLGMGRTAIATPCHWVGYAAIGFK